MSFVIVLAYGIIQGLTEFLPVSSSGHLALMPHLFHFQDPGVGFDLWMHLGTALAVVVYFRAMIKEQLILLLQIKQKWSSPELNFIKNFALSTLVTVILALIFKNFAATLGRQKEIIIFNLAIFALFMMVADLVGKKGKKKSDLNTTLRPLYAFLVGVFQAFAIFPGVSRSGITLTISRLLGMGREEATKYSFLLSLPIIFGGIVMEAPKLLGGAYGNTHLGSWCLGLLVSFLAGLASIHFFIKVVVRFGLHAFGAYRILLAVVLYFTLL